MYESHFGLRRRPFPTTPDGDCYYPATVHEQALAQITQSLQDGESFALLTGAPGTGKTLLGQRLLDQAASGASCVFLTHSHFADPAGLLQSLLYDLGLPHEGRSEQELRLALTDALLRNYTAGRPTLLILDEAHHLSPVLLEELRLLGNLEGQKGKALQVVLLAQEGVASVLSRPDLAAFHQRLATHARLAALDVHEAADYLLHHLRLAGGHPEAFLSDEALELLARGTSGIPRLLNRVGHAALRLAWQAGADAVDAEVALESLILHGLSPGEESEESVDVERDGSSPLEQSDEAAVLVMDALQPAENVARTVKKHESLESRRRLFAAPKRPA